MFVPMKCSPLRPLRQALAIAVVAAAVAPAPARAEPPPSTCPAPESAYTEENPRIERGSLQVGGRPYRYSVLLPDDYATSSRSYPVLYWLHGAGGNHVSAFTHPLTPRFFERLTTGQRVLVVIPEGGWVGMYSDWGHPGHEWETFHLRLVEHIDNTYRTRARRDQRAAAGFSMGGMGALKYAARHPHLFGSVASFSGLADTSFRTPSMKAFLTTAGPVLIPPCTGLPMPFGPWGDPLTHQGTWEQHNPTALAAKLRGTAVYFATGDGTPCDDADREVLARESPKNPLRAIEPVVRDANDTFRQALVAAGVQHHYNAYGCGIHSWRYWERELQGWWPRMMREFAATDRSTKRAKKARRRTRRTTLRHQCSNRRPGRHQAAPRCQRRPRAR